MRLPMDEIRSVVAQRKENGTFCKDGLNIIDEYIDESGNGLSVGVIIDSSGRHKCGLYKKGTNGEPELIENI